MSTPKSRARCLRGALVAACSAVVTACAHAAAGGEVPHGASLMCSMLVCVAVGAGLAGTTLEGRRGRLVGVIAALGVAQSLGHTTLMVAAGHHQHGGGLQFSPAMVAAHVVAAVMLGLAITSVEYLYVVCTSVLSWLRLFATAAARQVPRMSPVATNDVVAQSVLRCPGLGMRAPPRWTIPTA